MSRKTGASLGSKTFREHPKAVLRRAFPHPAIGSASSYSHFIEMRRVIDSAIMKATMEPQVQVSVYVDNKPGALAEIVAALAARGINILALSLAEGIDHGYVRLLVDRPKEAVRVLSDTRHLFFTRDVLVARLPHQPGALASLLARWGAAGVNVEYAYSGIADGAAIVAAKVDRPEAAVAAAADLVG